MAAQLAAVAQSLGGKAETPSAACSDAAFLTVIHSFIHVTPVAEAHTSNAYPFQTPPTPQIDKQTLTSQKPHRRMTVYHVTLHDTGQAAG
jgi:hypothetical protein